MNDQHPRRQWWKWLPAAAMLLCILLFLWKLREKYPKLLALETLHQRGSFPLAALTRAVGVVPGDLASLYFGAVRLPYSPYLWGSLVGLLPMMAVDTLLGKGLGGAMSPELLAALGISVLIAILSLLLCRKILKKTWNHKEQHDENSHRNRQQ